MTSTMAAQGVWRGGAFLTVANGVDPARRREYEAWHSFEHVPERLTMPGFLAGKRYVAGRGAATRYLTIYDLDDSSAVESTAYKHLLAHPTPASLAMRPVMTDVRRGLYRHCGQTGFGLPRHLGCLTWRGAVPDGLLGLAGRDPIISVRLGTSIAVAAHPAFPASPGEGGQPHWIALLGATERGPLTRALERIASTPDVGGTVIEQSVFDLILAY